MEFTKEEDFKKALAMEEEEVKKMCDEILRVKPDVVITEKGVSDAAQHFLMITTELPELLVAPLSIDQKNYKKAM
jgi:hypothetical protein